MPLQYHKKTFENIKNSQIKTFCHLLQHLIQITIIYNTIKSSVNCLKNNNVSGSHNIDLYKVSFNCGSFVYFECVHKIQI